MEVIVVCNGCTDATATIARGFEGPVRVIETEVASKTHALNLGDAAARGFPRLYVDADVVLTWGSILRIAAALEAPGVLAASPAAEMVFPAGTAWAVKSYYRLWMSLPYVCEGLMAAGGGFAAGDFFPSNRCPFLVEGALMLSSRGLTFLDIV